MATDVHNNEVDERPLSEKLADHVQPNSATFLINMTHGGDIAIVGTPHDIDRVKQACKSFMKRVESDKLDTNESYTIHVPGRDPT